MYWLGIHASVGFAWPARKANFRCGRLAVAGCCRLWQAGCQAVAGCGFLWLAVTGCGWLWLAVAGCLGLVRVLVQVLVPVLISVLVLVLLVLAFILAGTYKPLIRVSPRACQILIRVTLFHCLGKDLQDSYKSLGRVYKTLTRVLFLWS